MTRAAARDVLWSGVEAGAAALLSVLSAFVVARLIGPAEVGVAAAALAPHILLWVFVNALYADAIVQRPALTRAELGEAVTASTLAGVLAMLACAGAGPLLVALLHDGRLTLMALALAAPLPLVGAAGAAQGALTRGRAYRRLALRAVIGQGLGTAVAIPAALGGAGAWAVVMQQAVTASVGALSLLAGGALPWPRRPRRTAVELLRLGLPLAATPVLQSGRYRLFTLLLGTTAGAAALGQIHIAFRLVDTARDLCATALWRLLLPRLSERQRDRAALQDATDRALATYGALLFPAFGALFVIAEPLVRLGLGPAWAPAATAALPLILLACHHLMLMAGGSAMIARGHPRSFVLVNAAGAMLTLLGVLIIRPRAPLTAALIWTGAQLLTTPYALGAMGRALGTGRLRQLRAGVAPLALAAAAAAAALFAGAADPGTLIAERLAVGAAVVLPGLALLRPGWRTRPA